MRIKSLATLTFGLLLISLGHAADFTEGDYYQVLKGEVTTHKEVREYFSFYCPHCFNKEPLIKALQAELPADVSFVKNHISGMPHRKIEIENDLTKAAITANIMDANEQIIPAIFNYIHLSHADFDNVKDIHNLVVLSGVDADKFDQIFNSPAVEKAYTSINQHTDALREQGYSSVPTVVINGKYKVDAKNIHTIEEYIQLVLFLLDK
ncbi:thiol:disulfide interchange protein DsbA/DsbL [Neptunicella sp. SCSIO 80796]|uniref:thiol:disulfide interchange protein DsbA/DsbL n=1 Tax=Neptunicella plasticusilytica TaxID=3117012 RepID=UPI003A4DEEE9